MKVNLENYETWMIDYIEGNLSSEQAENLKQFLNLHPELNAELDLFEDTILKPDHSIVFQNKELLKKQEEAKVISFRFNTKYVVGIAAALLLFIGIQTFKKPAEYSAKEIKTNHITEPKFAFENKQGPLDSIKGDSSAVLDDEPYFAQTKKHKELKVEKKNQQKESEEDYDKQNQKINNVRQLEENIQDVEYASTVSIKSQTKQPKLKKLQNDLSAENYAEILGYHQKDPETIIDKYFATKAFAENIGNILGFTQKQSEMEDDYKETSIKIFNIEFYNGKKIN